MLVVAEDEPDVEVLPGFVVVSTEGWGVFTVSVIVEPLSILDPSFSDILSTISSSVAEPSATTLKPFASSICLACFNVDVPRAT